MRYIIIQHRYECSLQLSPNRCAWARERAMLCVDTSSPRDQLVGWKRLSPHIWRARAVDDPLIYRKAKATLLVLSSRVWVCSVISARAHSLVCECERDSAIGPVKWGSEKKSCLYTRLLFFRYGGNMNKINMGVERSRERERKGRREKPREFFMASANVDFQRLTCALHHGRRRWNYIGLSVWKMRNERAVGWGGQAGGSLVIHLARLCWTYASVHMR